MFNVLYKQASLEEAGPGIHVHPYSPQEGFEVSLNQSVWLPGSGRDDHRSRGLVTCCAHARPCGEGGAGDRHLQSAGLYVPYGLVGLFGRSLASDARLKHYLLQKKTDDRTRSMHSIHFLH